MNTGSHEDEVNRIRAEFDRRDREIPADFYAFSSPPNLFLRQGNERSVLSVLRRAGSLPLRERRILDVGCGNGTWLTAYRTFGAEPSRLAGLDLDSNRLASARADLPQADLRCGSADQLPWADGTFDLVSQFTMFTSILDHGLRARVAKEMLRVLKPGGAILWVDFMYSNPANKAVQGISMKEVRELFPSAEVFAERTSLAPPIARRLVPLSWTAAFLLQQLKVLNTHWAIVLRPSGTK